MYALASVFPPRLLHVYWCTALILLLSVVPLPPSFSSRDLSLFLSPLSLAHAGCVDDVMPTQPEEREACS